MATEKENLYPACKRARLDDHTPDITGGFSKHSSSNSQTKIASDQNSNTDDVQEINIEQPRSYCSELADIHSVTSPSQSGEKESAKSAKRRKLSTLDVNKLYYDELCSLFQQCSINPPSFKKCPKPRLFWREGKILGYEKLDEYLDKNHPLWSRDRDIHNNNSRKGSANYRLNVAEYIRKKWNTGLHIDLCQNLTSIPRLKYNKKNKDELYVLHEQNEIEIPQGRSKVGQDLLEEIKSTFTRQRDAVMNANELRAMEYFCAEKKSKNLKRSPSQQHAENGDDCSYCPHFCTCGRQTTATKRMDEDCGRRAEKVKIERAKRLAAARRLGTNKAGASTSKALSIGSGSTIGNQDPPSCRGKKRKLSDAHDDDGDDLVDGGIMEPHKKILNRTEIIKIIYSQNKHLPLKNIARMAREAEIILEFNQCYSHGETFSKQMISELSSFSLCCQAAEFYYPSPYVKKK
eukprot:TRINITY_DN5344_c0_g1_i12.p1 TRINITY_DN5344_c0_g1~~TRINITY_DN5344_c0_g1_i12.p1  ORF type:complete len:461 (-),score=95.87 TRINITY_DN5344_c0_g1_i12:836-2218(-)